MDSKIITCGYWRFKGGDRMEARDIFERDKLGEEISHQDPEYHKIREMIDEAQKLLFELNNKYHEEPEVRRLFSQLTGIEVDKTFRLRPPVLY